MKASQWIVLLLATNAGVAGTMVYLTKTRPPSVVPPAVGNTISQPQSKSVAKQAQAVVAPVGRGGADSFHWKAVESPDYKQYIANLRAIGCPEETIKDIIVADVTKLYAARLAALRPPAGEYKYWETRQPFGNPMDSERQKQYRAAEKEKRALLQELLGIDLDEERRSLYGGADYYERTMGFVPKEKRESLRAIQEKFQEMEQEVYRKTDGRIDPEDTAELTKIRKQRHDELAKVLTPQELLEYELRNSQTANQMRFDLAAFEPNEQEFRKIFEARNQFDNEFGRYGMIDPEDREGMKKRAEAQRKVDEELKAALGEARYTEYQRSQDYGYRELARVAKRYDLPKDTANKVYEMKRVAESQASKLRRDSSLNDEQRRAALKAIQDETQKTLSGLLGERGFKSYQRSGGYWMRNLEGPRVITRAGN